MLVKLRFQSFKLHWRRACSFMRRFNIPFSVAAMFALLVSIGATSYSKAEGAPADVEKAVTVAGDGSGDFRTIQDAVNAAPMGMTQRFMIRIKPATYKEKLTIPEEKGPITFQGEHAATTILTFNDHAGESDADGKKMGPSKSASILIQASDFHAENITFENSAGPHGRAVAVSVWSDRAMFRKCRFVGWQDTLLTKRNRQYFEDCYITGGTDFICGGATAWFERCDLHERQNSFITAASTPQKQPYGYVFSNCTITGEPGVKTFLGRPWRAYASVTYLNTTMHDVIRPEGWDNWGKLENEKTVRFAEYGSKTPGGKLIDLSRRVAWARRLTAEEAAAITKDKVLGQIAKTAEESNRSALAIKNMFTVRLVPGDQQFDKQIKHPCR
jgi:pectinesterase